ncbi:MAG: TetR family transcriptional regulator [Alicyclobacillus sp. RIFOXYA1_FULL_53_8]|nr:MAG: TetR family transcriptional regulator [Alicyclobacillus sp. RIFOXYA1_FULL_53_8]
MSVTVPTQVKDPERVRERRMQIIEASVRLFMEKGFHKTTTREIAKLSGLSNGSLYEYVESKEDVLFLVCQHIHREVETKLRQSLTEEVNGAVRLRHAMVSFLHVIDRMQAEVLLIYQESKSLPPHYLREVLATEQAITDIFEQFLRDGQADGTLEIEDAAIPILAHDLVVNGQMWAFRRWALKSVSFNQFVTQQVEMLMRACQAKI